MSLRRTLALLLAVGTLILSGCFGFGSKSKPSPDDAVAPAGASDEDPLFAARRQALLDPGEPFWPYREGTLEAAVDSTAKAEGSFRRALGLDPGYAPALTALSHLLYEEKRHDEAIGLLESAVATQPSLPSEAVEDLALHYDAVGRVDDARALLDRLPPAAPTSSVPAYVLLQADDTPRAAALAGAAADADPKSAVHRNNLGVAKIRAGNPVAARDALLAAVKIDPKLPGPLYNLALIERHFFMDDDAARSWFDRYWKLSHDDPDSLRRDLYPDRQDSPSSGRTSP